jgi:hypothetical protein
MQIEFSISKRRLAKKIDSFRANGEICSIWLMPDESIQIIITNSSDDSIIKTVNTRKDNLDEIAIASLFEQLKAENLN